MIEFLFGYFIGKDMQKDSKGTTMALLILPFAFAFCFWAYFVFIDFSKMVWELYLNYSAHTTVNIDFIILACLYILDFLVSRAVGDSKVLVKQCSHLLTKLVSSLVLPWVIFDLIYKMEFIEKIASVFGNGVSFNQFTSFGFFDDLSFYGLIVGSIGVGNILTPFIAIGIFGYMVYLSKNQAV